MKRFICPDTVGGGGTPGFAPEFLACKRNIKCYNRDMVYHKKFAFTLAEVLITLGIIGVVAAITIPNLVSKYQMKVFETAFKKQYSVFQNALNLAVFENGTSECYIFYTGGMSYQTRKEDCNLLKENLVSLLHLTPIKTDDKSYKYKLKSEVLAQGGKTVNSNCTYDDFTVYNNPAVGTYMTNDGAIVKLSLNTTSAYMPVMIFDVNGLKGPNKWGYDVFFMTLTKRDRNGSIDQKIFLTDEYCSIVEKGGRLPRNILQNKEKTEDSDFSWLWD